MQNDSAQAKTSSKVVGGLLFLTDPVYNRKYKHVTTQSNSVFYNYIDATFSAGLSKSNKMRW